MAKDSFEQDVERLFSQASDPDDTEAFVQSVSDRVTRLRRTERIIHTTAFSIGGLVAVLELSQPELWTAISQWTQRAVTPLAPLANPLAWTMTTNPIVWGVALGAVLLGVYVGRLLREN